MNEGFKLLLIVFAGSGLGGVARWTVQSLIIQRISSAFPLSTLVVNISGCFIIGMIYGLSAGNELSNGWKLALTTGFCGGFTTFSTFSFENLQLLKNGNYGLFAINIIASVLLGIAAVIAGLYMVKN